MNCPNCGATNAAEARWCTLCLSPLGEGGSPWSAGTGSELQTPASAAPYAPGAASAGAPPGGTYGAGPYGQGGYAPGAPAPGGYGPGAYGPGPYGQGPYSASPYGGAPGWAGTAPYPIASRGNAPGAVAALVCGLIGFFCFGVVLGIVAIVQGKKALDTINAMPGYYDGKGMAIAGIVLGAIDLAGWAILMIARFATN